MSVLRLKVSSNLRQLKQQKKSFSMIKNNGSKNMQRCFKHSFAACHLNNTQVCSFTWCHYKYYHQARKAEPPLWDEFDANNQELNGLQEIDNCYIEYSESVSDRKKPGKSKVKVMLSESFHFLYNLIEACSHANLMVDATFILQTNLQLKSPSVTTKTLDLYFYSLYHSSETHETICNMLQETIHKILLSDVPLGPVTCCFITATLGKFEERRKVVEDIVIPMLKKYPLHKALDHLDKHSPIYKHAVTVATDLGIKVKDVKEVGSGPVTHHPLIEKLYNSEATKKHKSVTSTCDIDLISSQFNQQMKEEFEGQVDVPNLLVNKLANVENSKEKQRKLADLKKSWFPSILQSFRSMKENEMMRWNTKRGVYPFLCILPEKDYVEVIINQLMSIPKTGEITSSLCFSLGQALFSRYITKTLLATNSDRRLASLYEKYANFNADSRHNLIHRQVWEDLEERYGRLESELPIMPWQKLWKLFLGSKMLEVLISSTTFSLGKKNNVPSAFFMEIPAVFNSYAPYGKRMFGMTIPHPLFSKLVTEAASNFKFNSSALPMLVPPLPWKSSLQGGFLLCPNDFVRTHSDMEFNDPKRTQFDSPNIYPIFDALNVLGTVAWRINTRILDLQIKILLAKGDQKLGIPPPGSEGPLSPFVATSMDLSPEERKAKRMQAYYAQKVRKEMHSLHCSGLYNLSIANKYRDKVIWFPHNLDFRGRAYPISRHFNYMGADVYRSLFLFADGKPLGEKGMDWLKIHITNLTGIKKRESTSDRLAYANEMLDEVFDSADNPLTGRGWWKKFEDRWQLLAACMELTSALRSPHPTKFLSHLPLHQDGSCNGLQHYAAMGRDIIGAEQVNLSPREYPLDVYTKVAEEVEKQRAADALDGNKVAISLEGKITRKVVKQTVMTTVYGVTRFGAQLQVRKQLEDKFLHHDVLPATNYTTQLLLQSVKSMFGAASEIQEWLMSCAKLISHGGQTVRWTTPLGLNATQPYFRPTTEKFRTKMQSIYLQEDSKTPNIVKQRNAFPPNFVHSLDSTHMMLTALYSYASGITFNSIHDCYWTHACDIDHMNEVCREHFVNLHEQPLLRNLAVQFRDDYLPPDGVQDSPFYVNESQRQELSKLISNLPPRGEFDLHKVKKSVYFFS